jgi:hypothetical protein
MSIVKTWIVGATAVAMSIAVGLGAQQAGPPSGTVTGHVTCGDTQRPARFATVLLFGVPATVTAAPPPVSDAKDEAQVMAAMKAGMAVFNSASFVQTQTDEDGAFSATGVAPGDYYVFASVPGYVQPVNLVKAAIEAGADPQKPLPGVPMVHVSAARESLASVSIDRGAAVSGKVVWEDGSPVTKATVTVVTAKGEKPLPPQYSMVVMSSAGAGGVIAITDDLGQFRIAGLAAGEYYVKVMLQTKSQFSMQKGKMNFNFNQLAAEKPLTVFAPAAFHQASAKVVTLTEGQDLDGQEIAINLASLHSVSGHVASAEDHHSINSGTISLTDANDKDFSRSASVNEDGSFAVRFVPSGNYTLKVEEAADTVPSTKKPKGLLNFDSDETVKSYDNAKQPVIVGDDDVMGQSIELTPSATVKKPMDIGGVLGSLMDSAAPPPAQGKQ